MKTVRWIARLILGPWRRQRLEELLIVRAQVRDVIDAATQAAESNGHRHHYHRMVLAMQLDLCSPLALEIVRRRLKAQGWDA